MGFIPNDVIGQILDRCDIVSVISAYIPLKPAGRNFKALCPFHHEKTPSFIINPGKQIFHCFGCGVGGNAISFIMQQEHLEFPEALRLLAEKTGVVIPEPDAKVSQTTQVRQEIKKINEQAAAYFHQNLLTDRSSAVDAGRKYLQGRGVNLETAKNFQLGFALEKWDGLLSHLQKYNIPLHLLEKAGLILSRDKRDGFYDRFRNRIIFPIFDSKGDCVAFGGRALEADASAKYLNSPETPVYTKGQHLYGFNWAREAVGRQDFIVVVEGYLDFITPFKGGVENVVASLGTALTTDQIRLIRRYTKNVVMMYDADQAGESATLRSLDLLIEEGMEVKVATLATGEDPDSFVRKYGVASFQERIEQAQSFFDFKLSSLYESLGKKTIEERRAIISAQMLPTINKFPSAVLKAEYVKRLASSVNVSENALLEELNKLPAAATAYRLAPDKPSQPTQPVRPAERGLLKLMLDEESFIALTKQAIELSDFQNEEVKQVIQKIYEFSDQGQSLNMAQLLSSFADQKILQLISSLMATEDPVTGDKEKIHRDCVQRLKEERSRSRRKDIRFQMEEARHRGDHQRLEELLQEFNHLIKG